MSRRSLHYRKALKGTAREDVGVTIQSRHRLAKSDGRTQLYIKEKDRRVPGVPGRTQCSMPMRAAKLDRILPSIQKVLA